MLKISIIVAAGLLGGGLVAQGTPAGGRQDAAALEKELAALDTRIGKLRAAKEVDFKELRPLEARASSVRLLLKLVAARSRVRVAQLQVKQLQVRFTPRHPRMVKAQEELAEARRRVEVLELEATLYTETDAYVHQRIGGSPFDPSQHLAIALAVADPAQRARLLADLAMLYEREGRHASARRTLAELAREKGRFGAWARQRLAGEGVQVGSNANQDAPAALTRLILKLDEGGWRDRKTDAGRAYQDLQELGVLAHSALVSMLDRVGPVGRQAILRLLSRRPGPALDQAVEKMLRSKDVNWQGVAADHLFAVTPENRARLARLALKSAHAKTREQALFVLASLGLDVDMLMTRARELAEDADSDRRAAAAQLLGSEGLSTRPGARELLQRLAHDKDRFVARRALQIWIAVASGAEERQRALELLDGQPGETQRLVLDRLTDEMRLHRVPPDPQVLARACLHLNDVRTAFSSLKEAGGTPDSALLAQMVLKNLSYGAREWAFERLTQRSGPDVERAVREVFANSRSIANVQLQAWSWMTGHLEPGVINAWLAELLHGNPAWPSQVSKWIGLHAEPALLPVLVEYLERHYRNSNVVGTLDLADIQRALAWRSDASSFEALLRYVRIPSPISSPAASSRARMFSKAVERWFGPGHVKRALAAVDGVLNEPGVVLLIRSGRVSRREHVTAIVESLQGHLVDAVSATPIWERREGPVALQRARNKARGSVSESPVDAHVVVTTCMRMLGRIGTPEAVRALESLLSHEDAWVRYEAVSSLMRCPQADKRALATKVLTTPSLQDFFGSVIRDPAVTGSRELRRRACELILKGGEADSLALLRVIPQDDARTWCIEALPRLKELRQSTCRTILRFLGDQKSAAMIPHLRRGLDHPDEFVRQTAVIQLGRTYSREAVPVLLEMLKDDEINVRQAARTALKGIREYLDERARWK